VKLLQGSPRYAGALGTGDDAAAYAKALQRGGYATDPDYATKLTAVAARLKSHLARPISVTGIHSA
jgi:flagellar protein FlgJ